MEDTQLGVGYDSLSIWLSNRFNEWVQAWELQHQEHFRNFCDRERIVYDGDTKGSGVPKANKARGINVGLTRAKIRAATAKIDDAHQSYGRYPYTLETNDPQLYRHVACFKDIIDWQLDEMGYAQLLSHVVYQMATYGTGVTVGPTPVERTITRVNQVNIVDPSTVEVEKLTVSFKLPRYVALNTMDCYPDPDSVDPQGGRGFFFEELEHPESLQWMVRDERYRNVKQAIQKGFSQDNSRGTQRARDVRGGVIRTSSDKRAQILRYFGLAPRNMVLAWLGANQEQPNQQTQDDGEYVEILAWLVNGVVVRVAENPYSGYRPVQKAVWEPVEGQWFGRGIAFNNEPHQKLMNAVIRIFIESKSMALLKPKIVHKGIIEPSESYEFSVDKTFFAKKNVPPEAAKYGITQLDIQDVSEGWQSLIQLVLMLSDDDTGVTKYTQGNDARGINSTATGVSLIMGAANLTLKKVMQRIDAMVDEHITRLIEWNLENLEPEEVEAVFGREHAVYWAQMKSIGTTAVLKWRASGASNFLSKELLANKLQQFMAIAAANPATAQVIKFDQLISEYWRALDVGNLKPPTLTPEEQQMASQQQMAAMQQEQEFALRRDMMKYDSAMRREALRSEAKLAAAQAQAEAKAEAEAKAKQEELMRALDEV